MDIGTFFIVLFLTVSTAGVHASLSDDITDQNIIFKEKQIELEHQKFILQDLESSNSWGALEKIPDQLIEVEYALEKLIESRDILHQLYQERSDQIKAERLERERVEAEKKILKVEVVPTMTGLTNLIGIDLSRTCEISQDCINYSDLIYLDSSNTEVSGKFIQTSNDIRRDKPQLNESWRWYDLDDQYRIIVDPPVGMAERIKMITITPKLDNYILKDDMFNGTITTSINMTKYAGEPREFNYTIYNNTEPGRVVFHDRYIDNCGDAMISSINWKNLLNDTITLLRNDCDPNYTEFEDREFIPTILTEIDITTSPHWQFTQWLNESIEKCRTLCFEY